MVEEVDGKEMAGRAIFSFWCMLSSSNLTLPSLPGIPSCLYHFPILYPTNQLQRIPSQKEERVKKERKHLPNST